MSDYISKLPNEILMKILIYLDVYTLLEIRITNHRFRNLLYGDEITYIKQNYYSGEVKPLYPVFYFIIEKIVTLNVSIYDSWRQESHQSHGMSIIQNENKKLNGTMNINHLSILSKTTIIKIPTNINVNSLSINTINLTSENMEIIQKYYNLHEMKIYFDNDVEDSTILQNYEIKKMKIIFSRSTPNFFENFLKNFSELTDLELYVENKYVDLKELKNLNIRRLYINSKDNCQRFVNSIGNLPYIEDLSLISIDNNVIDISPITNLPIRKLHLGNCFTENTLFAINNLPYIEFLRLSGFNIDSLSLSHITADIQRLELYRVNNIISLPQSTSLETVYFYDIQTFDYLINCPPCLKNLYVLSASLWEHDLSQFSRLVNIELYQLPNDVSDDLRIYPGFVILPEEMPNIKRLILENVFPLKYYAYPSLKEFSLHSEDPIFINLPADMISLNRLFLSNVRLEKYHPYPSLQELNLVGNYKKRPLCLPHYPKLKKMYVNKKRIKIISGNCCSKIIQNGDDIEMVIDNDEEFFFEALHFLFQK